MKIKRTAGVFFFLILAVLSAYGQTAKEFVAVLNKAGDGVIISGYTGKATTVQIPSKIEGLPVLEIAEGAFAGNQIIMSVIVPKGITIIGNRAFSLCPKLKSVSLPEGLVSMGNEVFFKSGLTSAGLPRSISSVPEGTFNNCEQLAAVLLHEGLKEIKKSAFASCVSLVEIKLPASIQIIGDGAFQDCASLTSVVIPDSTWVIKFGRLVFDGTKLNLSTQSLLRKRGYNN